MLPLSIISLFGGKWKKSFILPHISPKTCSRSRTYCKNYAVNAILSFYAEKAEKNGISTQVSIQMADPPVIPETEFCVLIGNLLENAVEACADTNSGIQPNVRTMCQTGNTHQVREILWFGIQKHLHSKVRTKLRHTKSS